MCVYLAQMAQRWADQCPRYHDKNRHVLEFGQQTSTRQNSGQNLAFSWNSQNSLDYELDKKIQDWFDEVENWPSKNTENYSDANVSGDVGHFTQIVWAKTKFVGCGTMYHKDLKLPEYPYKKVKKPREKMQHELFSRIKIHNLCYNFTKNFHI